MTVTGGIVTGWLLEEAQPSNASATRISGRLLDGLATELRDRRTRGL
ncbi:MAG TPA: hypothetical protein VMT85_20225 [Thermoanaerobaculia bacterium]|nr:hypothetical protein [Thermoanaerobaculia bacterium]